MFCPFINSSLLSRRSLSPLLLFYLHPIALVLLRVRPAVFPHRPLAVDHGAGHHAPSHSHRSDLCWVLEFLLDARVVAAVPKLHSAVMTGSHQKRAVFVVLQVRYQLNMGWDGLDSHSPPEVVDFSEVVAATDRQLKPIRVEIRAQDRVAGAQLKDALPHSQIPKHPPPPQVPRKYQGTVGVQAHRVDLLEVPLLAAQLLQLHAVPDPPRLVIGGSQECCSSRVKSGGVDPVGVGLDCDALLLSFGGVKGPKEYFAVEAPCNDVGGECWYASYSGVKVHITHFVYGPQLGGLLAKVHAGWVFRLPQGPKSAGPHSRVQLPVSAEPSLGD